MTLKQAKEGKEYIIKNIETADEELNGFLFTLGCYSDEPITVISQINGGSIVMLKNSRYSFDNQLSRAITVYE